MDVFALKVEALQDKIKTHDNVLTPVPLRK